MQWDERLFPPDLHLLSMVKEDLIDIPEYVQKKTDKLDSKIHIIIRVMTGNYV